MTQDECNGNKESARIAREMLKTNSLKFAIIQADMAREQAQSDMATFSQVTLPAQQMVAEFEAQRDAVTESLNFNVIHELVQQQHDQRQALAREVVSPAREIQLTHHGRSRTHQSINSVFMSTQPSSWSWYIRVHDPMIELRNAVTLKAFGFAAADPSSMMALIDHWCRFFRKRPIHAKLKREYHTPASIG